MPLRTAYFQMSKSSKTADDERPRNQDALFNGKEVKFAKMNKSRWVEDISVSPLRVAVADGVFESPQPHLASRFWVNIWAEQGACSQAFFQRNFDTFCDEVGEKAYGASTVFAGAVVQETGEYQICNIGDSRVYHISTNGTWTQISHDHTLLNKMLATGEAKSDVQYADFYNDLAQCLIADHMSDDFDVFITSGRLQIGEALLLCTDGLSDSLTHEQLETLWCSQRDTVARLETLRQAVKCVHRHDDCSVVCVDYLA